MNEIIKIDENTIGITQEPIAKTKEQLLQDKKSYEDAITYHTDSIVSLQLELDKVSEMLSQADKLGVKTQEEIKAVEVEVSEEVEPVEEHTEEIVV